MKKTPLKRKTSLKVAGQSTISELKADIQALLRQVVMKRDKGCILRMERGCGNEVGMEGVVFQADHLIERSNSATYADSRLVVCVCKGCHGWKHFKKSNHDQYNAMVKKIIPESRVKLWERCERDSWRPDRKYAIDWKLAKIVLEKELKDLLTTHLN